MNVFVGGKPDRKHIQALTRCKQPEHEQLLALFRVKLSEAQAALLVADDLVRIHRLQGRAEALADFLDAVEKSYEILDRVN